MSLSHPEAKQLLERLIFDEESPQVWVQDVWDMSPTLGETAAKLSEIFSALVDCCPADELDQLLKLLYQDQLH
ncbi:hypothetical protein [Lyngbya confervoides]|uniref:Uncharacterized protein n=1 Tax=Lyngbya confervoides BDU141951 TaxID=1574623 RepID=A0ABD4T9M1_9CYAN|nr:hypothetical protein [Lyngbya confervoides]MCM1985252.1 hypothetical protein [Lyngbya confervoides BDU141951]